MKNLVSKITCLMVSLLALGCATTSEPESIKSEAKESSSINAISGVSSSSLPTTSTKEHNWSRSWSYDETNHWFKCSDRNCNEVKNFGPHNFGEPEPIDASTLKTADQYKYAIPMVIKCQTCGYILEDSLTGTNLVPEVRFTFDENDPDADFATKAKKDDLDRPEVSGTLSITNCPDQYKLTDVAAGMKVRGNQTANWSKKAFRIKLDKKQNLLGLNGGPDGKGYKKWILLADAKDTTLIRSEIGLTVSKAICADQESIWVSNLTPVSVYLNDQYWGYYYLGEQKEAKAGRINLPEIEDDYVGTDIGYCFELDYYAKNEPQKADGGDPTFSVSYKPKSTSYTTESVIANYGSIKTYTLLSDITDGPADTAVNEKNSEQVAFIKKKVENLYTILYEAAMNKTAKALDENDDVIASNESIEKVISDYFDLGTFADGFIINAFDCAPDLGYSSFYMSFDNSATGSKKLRYDNPWDFDSNFGNRNGFIPVADTASSSSASPWGGSSTSYDPYYMDRTSNMWLQLLGKLDFFMDIVKERWNEIREKQIFEDMFTLMRTYFKDYDAEFKRNFYRWPTNDAAQELRDPFKKTSDYLKAQTETINWCSKRINYLEKKWGNNRPDVNTGE